MAKFSKALTQEIRSRAKDQARWLIRDHGNQAETVLAAKMQRRRVGAADMERYRLILAELKRLRGRAPGSPSTAVAIRKSHMFSFKGLLRLFQFRKHRDR